jgi:hypothetical protein
VPIEKLYPIKHNAVIKPKASTKPIEVLPTLDHTNATGEELVATLAEIIFEAYLLQKAGRTRDKTS